METQVVLSNDGMSLRNNSAVNVATFGTTTKFFDGVGHADSNRKLQLNADGIFAFGDDTNTFTKVFSKGIQIVKDSTDVGFFSDVVRVGALNQQHVSMSAAGVTFMNSATQIGKISGHGALLGNTSAAHISASTTDVSIIRNANNKAVISADGMKITQGGNEVADFGSTVVIGEVGSGKSNVQITSGAINLRSNTTNKLVLGSDGSITIGNQFSVNSDGDATFSGTLTVGSLPAGTVSGSAQLADQISGSSAAAVAGSVASASAAQTTANTGVANAATAQGTANSAQSTANTANTAATAMATQVVLDSNGMSLKNQAANLTLASFGTTVTIGEVANSKSRMFLDSDSLDLIIRDGAGSDTNFASFGAITRIGDVTNEHISMSSTGVAVKDGGTQLANFAATTTIGSTSTEHVEITSTSLKLKDDTTDLVSISGTTVTIGSDSNNRVQITPSSMQIGSTGGGITMDSSGNATFNGTITIGAGLAASISGSSAAAVAGSVTSASAAQSTANTANTAAGNAQTTANSANTAATAMATQVVLDSNGMSLKNQAADTTLASFGTTVTIGQNADDKSRIFIDNDSVDLIVDAGGTDTTQASFGAITTIGPTATEHIKLSSAGLQLKDGNTTRLSMSAAGIEMGDNFAVDASGNVTMAGTVTATAGDVGGFIIQDGQLTGSGPNDNEMIITGSGLISAGDLTNALEQAHFGVLASRGQTSVSASLSPPNATSAKIEDNFVGLKRYDADQQTGLQLNYGNFFKIAGEDGGEAAFRVGRYNHTHGSDPARPPYILFTENEGLEISSSKFRLTDGDLLVKKISATEGTIGGFTVGSNTLTATNFELNPSLKRLTLGTSNSIFIADGDEGIQLGNATFADAPFNVDIAGRMTASSALITGSNVGIDTPKFLLADGNVTMSGDISADKGTFRDVNILGSLVENSSGNGTLNLVETWMPTSAGVYPNGNSITGDPTDGRLTSGGTLSGSTGDLATRSTWGWTDSTNLTTQVGDPANSTQAPRGMLHLGDQHSAFDPAPALFKGTNQMEGLGFDTRGTNLRARNSLYDAPFYKDDITTVGGNSINGSQPYGQQGGIPKLGIIDKNSGSDIVGFHMTSDGVNLGLTQTSIYECNLEFASRDGGAFGGFATDLTVTIFNSSNNANLYEETKRHTGTPNAWVTWSIPLVAKAGLVTRRVVTGAGEDAFDIIPSIKIKLSWADSGNSGGGTYAGTVLTEMRIRKSPYISFLTTQLVAADTFVPGIGSTTIEIDANSIYNRGNVTGSRARFTTVNTGHGNNELYAMNQDVQTTDSVTFDDVTVSDELKVNDYARIDALRVGTTSSDPGDGRLYVEDYGVFVGGVRVGSSSDPGANNLSVAGDITVGDDLFVGDCAHIDALHVGTGTDTDPGDGNLHVDNDLTVAGKIFQGTSDTVYFEAQCTGGTTVAHDTYTKVEYNSEAVDLGGDYSTTYDRFTAPVNGVYFFSAQFLWSNSSDWDAGDNPIISFSINDTDGSDARVMHRTGNFTEYFSMHTTAILKLDAGDTVHVDAFQNTGTTLYIYDGGGEASYNQFMGTLVHALT